VLLQVKSVFSQQDSKGGFNSLYWNTHADKLHLEGKEREEFIHSHIRQQSPAPVSPTQAPQAAQRIMPPNNIFAGPCINADFEAGNLTGWVPTSGFNPGFNPSGCCPNVGGQQIIMSGAGLDPYGGFPVVCPGGNFSLRLGDNVNGGHADRIEQTFLVSPSNANFSYKYAVVLEDPGHPPSQQPSFQVEMRDTTNALVPCTFFYVAAGQGIPGFSNSPTPGVIYKPWTTVLIDLSPYMGQNITIRFTTFDCSLGGHFGYAYIDGVCQSFTGGGSATVCAGTAQNFCAPTGLASYTWNGPGVTNFVGQCVNATLPGVYTVQTTLFSNCNGPAFTYTLGNQPMPVPNAGPNMTVCANNNLVSLTGSITGYSSTPLWSSSGSGAFSSTTSLSTTYTPSPADIGAGLVTLSLTTANNGLCPAVTSTLNVTITPSPVVNAGSDQTICATAGAALNGTVTGTPTAGIWSSSGTGTFSPSPSILNATYFPSPADISAGSVTLTLTSTNNQGCIAVSDNMLLFFQPPPLANAGASQSVCANNNPVSITGSITGWPSTANWLSSGSGVFTSTSNLTTTYTPSNADILSGSVTLTLTTLNNGVCPPSTSTLQVNITPAPVVNAGTSQTVCSNSSAPLSGSVTGPTSSGIWTTAGDGTFAPSPTVLNASYMPGPNDIANGSVTLSLTSTGNGNCLAVTSTVSISFHKIATVNAGPSQSVCSTASSIALSGTVTGSGLTGLWTTNGSGSFNPGPTALNASYIINPADVGMGTVIFTLSSTNNGPCPVITGTTSLNISLLAQVNAGNNQFICESSGTIGLSGTINNGSGTWTSDGTGTYNPNNNTLNTTYSITPADINNGSVTFTLTSINNGACPAVSDSVKISIKKLATVNAGASQSVCSTAGSILLNGIVGGGTSTGLWSTNGNGSFNPGPTALNASYLISNPGDVGMGTVIFTLTSTNNGPCPVMTSTTSLSISLLAQVNAGNNQFICESSGTIALNGSVNIGSGAWTSDGTGTYNPNNISLNTTYSITPTDINNGSVSFTLTSTNNGACPAISDSVKIAIKKLAIVNAGASQSVCSTAGSILLNGNISGGTSTGLWSTNGNGSFNPGPGALNASYLINPADIGMGTVVFTLTSTNNGPCPVITNTTLLSISLLAQVNSGSNQFICENSGTIALNGTINNGAGVWSSDGTGTYNPGINSLNTTYSITPSDISNGSVSFTLTSINNGACPAISDSVKVNIKRLAIVNAGNNQAVCSTNGSVSLSGNIGGGSSTGLWSTNGNGVFNPGVGSLNTTYFLVLGDINAGSIVFTLTSSNNGPCPAMSDTTMLRISVPAQVNAGPNQLLCESSGTIGLNGSVNSGNGIWSSSGTGSYSPDNLTMNSAYTMSGADINAGFVTFTLTSTNNGACPPVRDSVKVAIKKLAVVNAGIDKQVCSVNSTVALAGNVSGGSSTGVWSTNGSGFFTPNNNSLNNVYNISNGDMSAGSLTVILTSLNNGICPAVADSAVIRIFKNPTISLSDTSICSYQDPVKISPVVSGYVGNLLWTTSGTGSFSPSNISNPVKYNFSNDLPSTSVTLTLSATNNGPCADVKASIRVAIHPTPTAEFTPSTYTANIPNDPISFTNQSFQANAYYWSFGDGNSSGAVSPIHNYLTVGFYNVMLIATNQFGCSDTAFKDIKVVSDIQYPNAFTPNPNSGNGGAFSKGDLSNDVFFPYTAYEGVTGYDLQIFNRWGELIFESKDVQVGWDGYFKGKLCQQDVYVWKARVQFFDGRLYEKTGSVTLLR
jgi:gliding motility-associated-like protein